MSDGTKIQWTDASWNPLRARLDDDATGWACVRVSQGCVNCYAATINKRLGTGLDYTVPALAKVVTYVDPDALSKPLGWKKARRVFVCSMTDLFGEWVSDDEIGEVFDVMARAPRHTFQVLTKRPKRMREWVNARYGANYLPNVWLGTSVENQEAADERLHELEQTFAAIRFLSCEPLIGPVEIPGVGPSDSAHLDWIIVGGESGPRARGMDLAWARDLVTQAQLACTAVFVKQLGRRPWELATDGDRDFVEWLRLRDSHGGDPAEWPEDLRIREWPDVGPEQ